jgi:ubiquinone/menaquinone biosynthesis C-methylase UbiE
MEVRFDRGFADALDYPDASFDRVFSSFMFHHLAREEKEATLRAVRRVLKPGGSLHLLDFGGQTILGFLADAGLTDAAKTAERVTLGFVRIVYYRAGRPRA